MKKLVTQLFFALALLAIAAPAFAEISIGGLNYSVKSVLRTTVVGSEFMRETADGEFIIVKISVRNTGHEPATISDSDFHLKNGDVTYDASSKGMMNGGFFLAKLNPGVSKTGSIIFDVPANTSPSKYKLVVYGNGTSESKNIQL